MVVGSDDGLQKEQLAVGKLQEADSDGRSSGMGAIREDYAREAKHIRRRRASGKNEAGGQQMVTLELILAPMTATRHSSERASPPVSSLYDIQPCSSSHEAKIKKRRSYEATATCSRALAPVPAP